MCYNLTMEEQVVNTERKIGKLQQVERSLITAYKSRIFSKFTEAVKQYQLIEDGDKIAVCISGGKDSMLMAKCFQELKRHGKNNFELEFLVMDPGYPSANTQRIVDNAKLLGVPITVFKSDIYAVTENVKGSPCFLCARMRRGFLYAKAQEMGCNKIALGHHFDDVVETILMSVLYNGQMQSMRPKLRATNFKGMQLIRPLYLVRERDIIAFKNAHGLEFLQCDCRRERSGKEGKRSETKALVAMLEKQNSVAPLNIFNASQNVMLDTLLGYKKGEEEHFFLEEY